MDNALLTFNLTDIYRSGLLKGKQTAQSHQTTALIVDDLSILSVFLIISGTDRTLKMNHSLRSPHMLLTVISPVKLSTLIKRIVVHCVLFKGFLMNFYCLISNIKQIYTFNRTWGILKVFINKL